MIAYLEGRLLEKAEASCLVLTAGGVGYEVALTRRQLAELPVKGEPLALYVATIVREDAIELYGFATPDERSTFVMLISISKLGPKTALGILSLFTPGDLARIVRDDDINALTKVSGIGKKSAQHIFLELKYKLKAAAATVLPAEATERDRSVFQDALAGLLNLGYAEEEARRALEQTFRDEDDLDVAQALRQALKFMAKARA